MITKKQIYFDIDGTICTTKNSDDKNSKVKKKMIKLVNTLYEKNTIIFFTARYMGRYKGNTKLVKKKYLETKNQLIRWGFKFHKLTMGKPRYDYLIDDKAYNVRDPYLKKLLK